MSTSVENPAIPLVGGCTGHFRRYTDSKHDNTFDNSALEEDKLSKCEAEGDKALTPLASNKHRPSVLGPRPSRWDNVSYRLLRRKQLLWRWRLLVDLAVVTAGLGLAVMLVETELYIEGVLARSDVASWFLRMVVSLSTLFLLAMVLAYNITTVEMTMVDNSLDDWRLAVSLPFVSSLLLELVVCAVHPLPISLPSGGPHPRLEGVLSVLMFLRLYLVARFLVVHSRYLNDTATRSLGALNKVRIDTLFVFKALMCEWPGSALIVSMVAIFLLSGWSVRTCEAYVALAEHRALNDTPAANIPEAFWFSAITFLTVGYGDVVPRSECGRVTAVATGLLGVGVTALLVAVMANKLQQSRAEKYVHTFISRIELDKRQKHAAADVIKNVIKLWRMRGYSGLRADRARVLVHGKLLQAIRTMREARTSKVNIGEAAVGVIEINTGVTDVARAVEMLVAQQNALRDRTERLEGRLVAMDAKLDALLAGMRLEAH